MLRREKANVPALMNRNRPNRTSGRRVRLKVRNPLSRDGPLNYEERDTPSEQKLDESFRALLD
jgi:hypothetical protein